MAFNSVKERLAGLRRNKRVLGCIGAILAVALASGALFSSKGAGEQDAEASVRSAVAEKGNISTSVTGTGTLENGEASDILIPTGIKVEKVLVESGDTVVKGQQLATLDEVSVAQKLLEVEEALEDIEDEIDDLSSDADDSTTTEYLKAKVLAGEKEELKEAETKLKKFLKSGEITASQDGIISSVYVEADTTIGNGGEDGEDSSETTDNGSGNLPVKTETGSGGSNLLFLSADVTEGESKSNSDEGNEADNIKISSCSIDVEAPVTGAKPQTELGAADYFTGTISWDCSSDTFQAETSYTATIKLTAKKGYEFSKSILPEVKGADVSSEVLESDSGESILKIKARFTKTGKDTESQQSSGSTGQDQENAQTQDSSQGQTADSTGKAQEKKAAGTVSGSVSAKGSGGSSGASSSASGSAGTDASETAEYNSYETAAFSIAEQEKTTVSINVDELDILSVKEGQTAEITLDALEDQSFQGTITGISQAVSGSGSTKYPVEISLERTEDMRIGMSASATIYIEEAENAVLIPVSALQEKADKTFVYTESDGEGKLSGETEVTTGLSDGSRVEITGGLSEGDTVYYLRTGSEDGDSSLSFPGMGGMPGGGEMPGDGQMPGGGGNHSGGGERSGGDRSGGGNRGDGK